MDPLRPPLLKRLRTGHWVAIDWAVTVLIAFGYVVVWRDLAFLPGPRWAVATIVAAGVLPVAFRRRWPRAVLALVVAAAAVATSRGLPPEPALAVAFAMYLIPLRLPRREALCWLAGTLLVLAAGLGTFVTRTHLTDRDRNPSGLLLISALLVAIAWMIGDSVRQQRAYTATIREQTQRQASAQLAEARRAISEERLRIARELHDVVAHTMSVIAVQAGVANYVAREHPEEATRALLSIEQTSRGALHEMRALLGVLRADRDADGNSAPPRHPDADLLPAPGLAELDGLIRRTAGAGVRVELDVSGERPPLSAGLDLAAYRVVQEAITNVIKHAATDRCRVAITYREDALMLEVTDNGTGRPGGEGPTAGHGIVGMRERVGMYGGQFRAAPVPSPGHGFQVTARFPVAGIEA